jgi:aldehyde dehydrogenase (NAD+)
MQEYSPEKLKQIFDGQKLFFASGKTQDLDFRKGQLEQLKAEIINRQTEINEALQTDLGKCSTEAYMTEVGIVLKSLSHAIKNLKYWAADQKVPTPIYLQPAKSFIVKEPYGNVLIIAPFNYPFQLAIEPLIGALAAGNTCIIKPSEFTPATSAVIKKIIAAVFDPIYVAVVEGDKEVNTNLLELPFDHIFFTGSTQVGKIVMAAAAKNLTPVTLELGGKSPVIVDETADLTQAAKKIIWGKMLNMGQTCVAPDYILANEKIIHALLSELQSTVTEFYGQNPADSPDLGKIINRKHFDRLKKIIEEDKKYLVFGGKTAGEKLFIEPTVFKIPDLSAASMQEELFGPLLPVLSYNDFNEVKAIISKNPKPLALYIFSENKNFQQYFIDEISAGGVCINDTIQHLINPNLPFGGVGNSGIGSYHGKHSFDTFSHQKSVLKKSTKAAVSFLYPPYKKTALTMLKKIFK